MRAILDVLAGDDVKVEKGVAVLGNFGVGASIRSYRSRETWRFIPCAILAVTLGGNLE